MKKSSKSKSKAFVTKRLTKSEQKGKFGGFLIIEKLPGYFLLLCMLLALGLIGYILSPFLTEILVAAFLVVAFYPVYKKLNKWFRGLRGLASFVSVLLLIILVLAPLSVVILLITSEASDAYQIIQSKIESGVFDQYFQWSDGGYFYELKERIQPVIDLDSIDLKQMIVDSAQSVSSWLVAQTGDILKGVGSLVLGIVILIMTMYYFFKDGDKLVDRVGKLSPLPIVYEHELFNKIRQMVKAIVFGVFLTSIVQGILGGIGFAIVGISNPVFWGTAMAFLSLVPVVGTALIWAPAAIVMAILGSYGAALFLVIWGLFLVGTIDNFLKPYLIGNRAHTYPLMTFLVVLGGIIVMDLKGVILGPIMLVILMSFLHIYEAEYKRVLKK
ncbi:MAG: AI-2E family transporter [Nitrospirae bacterium]|nr:AI-2E family transporter [Nitrospirota bacterium]